MSEAKKTRQELLKRIARLEAEPASCPCKCHKPKHAARQPHANTMAGRK